MRKTMNLSSRALSLLLICSAITQLSTQAPATHNIYLYPGESTNVYMNDLFQTSSIAPNTLGQATAYYTTDNPPPESPAPLK
jgi:hypothetical protein